jgi:hypothetical protein
MRINSPISSVFNRSRITCKIGWFMTIITTFELSNAVEVNVLSIVSRPSYEISDAKVVRGAAKRTGPFSRPANVFVRSIAFQVLLNSITCL